MLASIVDVGALLNVIWASFAAGVGLAVIFSVTIAGAARASHHRREGRASAAMGWGVVAVLCGMVCAAAVVIGVTVMLHK
jgi:hypothetical protein